MEFYTLIFLIIGFVIVIGLVVIIKFMFSDDSKPKKIPYPPSHLNNKKI